MTTRVYLGVGSNLNRENSLRFAVANLEPLFKTLSNLQFGQAMLFALLSLII